MFATSDLLRALAPDEVDELIEFLDANPEALPYPEARGYLTAIGSAPTTISSGDWIEGVLGEPRFETEAQARRIFGLVVRLNNEVISNLETRTWIPLSNDDVAAWCRGYMTVVTGDDVWRHDEGGAALVLPMAILAGDFDLVGEKDIDGNVIEDPAPFVERARNTLGGTVHDAYAYWLEWRRAHAPAPPTRPAKIGRNEPCPCGSGRKYKKCCALKES